MTSLDLRQENKIAHFPFILPLRFAVCRDLWTLRSEECPQISLKCFDTDSEKQKKVTQAAGR